MPGSCPNWSMRSARAPSYASILLGHLLFDDPSAEDPPGPLQGRIVCECSISCHRCWRCRRRLRECGSRRWLLGLRATRRERGLPGPAGTHGAGVETEVVPGGQREGFRGAAVALRACGDQSCDAQFDTSAPAPPIPAKFWGSLYRGSCRFNPPPRHRRRRWQTVATQSRRRGSASDSRSKTGAGAALSACGQSTLRQRGLRVAR